MVVAGHPQAQHGALGVGCQRFFLLAHVAVIMIDVTELIETQVLVLVIDVAGHTLHAPEEQRLPHDIEVAAQRIHDVHTVHLGIGLALGIIGRWRERVVHHLVVAQRGQLVADVLLHVVGKVHLILLAQAHMHAVAELDVVVAIHTQDVLDHIARTLHVHTIGGNLKLQVFVVLGHNLHLQAGDDALDGLVVQFLADETSHIIIAQVDRKSWEVVGLDIDDVATDFAARQLLDQHGGQLEVIDRLVGVDAALKAERRVGVQPEAAGSLAYPRGMEVGALQEHIGRLLGHTRVQTAKHAANAHLVLGVANHQVALGERALHAVQGHKLGAGRGRAHHHAVTLDLLEVKAVHGLPHAQQHIVGDVNNHVDGTLSHSHQPVTQPLGAFAHFDTAHRDAAVARASLGVAHLDGDAAISAVNLESLHTGAGQRALATILLAPCSQVACHAIVRRAVDAVGLQSERTTAPWNRAGTRSASSA